MAEAEKQLIIAVFLTNQSNAQTTQAQKEVGCHLIETPDMVTYEILKGELTTLKTSKEEAEKLQKQNPQQKSNGSNKCQALAPAV